MDENAITQAILELADQLKHMEDNMIQRFNQLDRRIDTLEIRIDAIENKLYNLEEKIDKSDAKLSILADEMLTTKADVKLLQKSQVQ